MADDGHRAAAGSELGKRAHRPARRSAAMAACNLAALLSLAWVVGGCRPQPTTVPGMTTMKVEEVTFDGVAAVEPDELREALATRVDRYNPFTAPVYFNRFAVAADIQRIETFYQMRGYFDAEVVDYRVDEDEDDETVRVHFVVEEGLPSYIDEVHYETRRLRQIDAEDLLAGLRLREGTVFNAEAMESFRVTMRRRLQENSYAYARVEARAYVDPEAREVAVYYFFEPGPSCLFGEIRVRGNSRIPPEVVARRVPIRTGRIYKQSLLPDSQQQLYDLNVFSFVNVEPVLGDESAVGPSLELRDEMRAVADRHERAGHRLAFRFYETGAATEIASTLDALSGVDVRDPNVPILVTVVELPRATYRVGAGLGIESGRTGTFGRGAATWRDVISALNQVDLEAKLGYAWLPSVFTRDEEGIVGQTRLTYRRASFLGRLGDLSTWVGYSEDLKFYGEQDVSVYYRQRSPRARVGIRRRLSRHATLDAGYNVNLIFNVLPDRRQDFRLAFFDASVIYDRRDNAMQAYDGYYLAASTQIGEPVALGQFGYVRFQPEGRYYIPVHDRISIATRLALGSIYPSTSSDDVEGTDPETCARSVNPAIWGGLPISQRLHLGGADSIRGYAESRLSPFATVCDTRVAVGGLSSYTLNIEPRFELGKDWLYGALFVDVGNVVDERLHEGLPALFDDVQVATGVGLRIATPAGPIRFDLGFRVTDFERGPSQRPVAFFLTIGEAF